MCSRRGLVDRPTRPQVGPDRRFAQSRVVRTDSSPSPYWVSGDPLTLRPVSGHRARSGRSRWFLLDRNVYLDMRLVLEGPSAEAEGEPQTRAGQLVSRYWESAYRFAAMVARDDQDSADIAQEALAAAIRRFDRFDPARGSFDAWLWRIVLNTARDAGRASVRHTSLLDRLNRYQAGIPEEDIESLAIRSLSDRELLEAVRSLRPRPRTLIALRFGAQLSYAEIAVQLGSSESAALMATRRALAVLRRQLEVR